MFGATNPAAIGPASGLFLVERADGPTPALPEALSQREIDILRLIAQGMSNREISAALSLAEGTVKNYVTTVLQKLGARDRTQAALRARELGLLP